MDLDGGVALPVDGGVGQANDGVVMSLPVCVSVPVSYTHLTLPTTPYV